MTGFRDDGRTAEAVHAQADASAEAQDPMLGLRYYLMMLSPLYIAGATYFLSALARLGSTAWRSDAVVPTTILAAAALVMLLTGFAAPIVAIRTWRRPQTSQATARKDGASLRA